MTFGNKSQLQVTYLTSYTNIGVAELTIHNLTALQKFDNSTAIAAYMLDGRIGDAVSIPKTTVILQATKAQNDRVKSLSLVLPGAVGAGDYIVALRSVPPQAAGQSHKFKLLGIVSC